MTAAPGWRQCMQTSPHPTYPFNQKFLVGPASFCCGSSAAWLGGLDDAVLVPCVGAAAAGPTNGHWVVDINGWGVSQEGVTGGIDKWCFPDGSGAYYRQPDTLYNLFVVARQPVGSVEDDLNHWGLVLVPGTGPYGRAATVGPSAHVQAEFPYYCPIDWLWTSADGSRIRWLTSKTDHDWQFVGAPGQAATFPFIQNGSTNDVWTGVFSDPATPGFGSSANCGQFVVALHCMTPGTYVDFAPNVYSATGYSPLRAAGTGSRIQGLIIPDRGACGYRSTDPAGGAALIGGYDAF